MKDCCMMWTVGNESVEKLDDLGFESLGLFSEDDVGAVGLAAAGEGERQRRDQCNAMAQGSDRVGGGHSIRVSPKRGAREDTAGKPAG